MEDKRLCDEPSEQASKKQKRRVLSLEIKAMIIKLSAEGYSNSEIGRRFNLPRTTVVTIVKDKARILDEVGTLAPIQSTVIRKREGLVAEMEKLLNVWIADQTRRRMHLSQASIREKALSFFEDVKRRLWDGSTDVTFNASRGWFARFKSRCDMNSIKVQSKASDFAKDFAKIVEDGGYCSRRVFTVDEMDLVWKMMPSKAYVAKEAKLLPGYNAADDRLTLLLGANAFGDCKLKPLLVYHSENPSTLEGHPKNSLPVMWRSNCKAAVTIAVFEDWFSCYFVNAAKSYCQENDLPFKVLLVVDSTPGHPQGLEYVHPNIKVVFLPPNTSSALQPSNQGMFKAFKSCYLQRIYTKAAMETGKRGGATPMEFWTAFNILDAIYTINASWEDLKATSFNCAWKKLCPQFVKDPSFVENPDEVVIARIFDLAKQMDLEVGPQEFTKLIESHSRRPLSIEDLNSEANAKVESESDDEEPCKAPVATDKELTCRRLSEAFKLLERAMAIFEGDDPDLGRSIRVNEGIFDQYACYREMYVEMKNAQRRPPWVSFGKDSSAPSQANEARRDVKSERSSSESDESDEPDDHDESSVAPTSFLEVTF